MTLGEKIRQARLDAGLSQRQAAGTEITRNMLSQLEHDAAKPSMRTLTVLAERLGKSVSYFLEDTAGTSPNQQVMQSAREAYEREDYSGTVAALETYREPDGQFDRERELLLALAYLEQGRRASRDGKPRYARERLVLAAVHGEKTPYWTQTQERERLLLLWQTGEEKPEELAEKLPADDRELLLRAEAALQRGLSERCGEILDAAEDQTAAGWNYLRAESYFARKQYTLAVPHYLRAEKEQPRQVLPRLEECYRELGEYKLAYECACRQREMG